MPLFNFYQKEHTIPPIEVKTNAIAMECARISGQNNRFISRWDIAAQDLSQKLDQAISGTDQIVSGLGSVLKKVTKSEASVISEIKKAAASDSRMVTNSKEKLDGLDLSNTLLYEIEGKFK